jgi:hypothetical protein
MARSLAARSSNTGYALLTNQRAVDLLSRISAALARWEAITVRLRATHSDKLVVVAMGVPKGVSRRSEAHRARVVASNMALLRHHYPHVARLHAEMLAMAREAWRVINRPNDICCGPCPTMISRPPEQGESPCGTMLYAEENSTTVVCPYCHVGHHVETLRDVLKAAVADMLFTRAELVQLMETRLNDRIPQSTFTKMLRDGRLAPRKTNDDAEPMFTYNDVCEARLKPVPHKRIQCCDTP